MKVKHLFKKRRLKYKVFLILKKIQRKIIILKTKNYYKNKNDVKYSKEMEFLRNYGIEVYPYDWIKEYENRQVYYGCDKNSGLPYISIDNKVIYYKNDMKLEQIQNVFNRLCMDVDLESPHRYVTHQNDIIGAIEKSISEDDVFYVEHGDVVVDLGGAEGNFSLSIIDVASHVYLFEGDESWLEPLQKTFESYKDKITIINKYIGDIDTENMVRLDTYFENISVDFIKADVEGYEQQMIDGGKELFSKGNLKAAICTYHLNEDAENFKTYFNQKGYTCRFTNGYMMFPQPNFGSWKEFKPKGIFPVLPFRKGVLRIENRNKNN